MRDSETQTTLTLEQQIEIELAKETIHNANRYLDWRRCEGEWKPRSILTILLEGPRRLVPVTPVPPLPFQIKEAEEVLKRFGVPDNA